MDEMKSEFNYNFYRRMLNNELDTLIVHLEKNSWSLQNIEDHGPPQIPFSEL